MLKIITLLLLLTGCQSNHENNQNQQLGPIKAEVCPEVLVASLSKESLCRWQVKFSPNGGAEKQVVDTIMKSNKSIYMLSYSFTSKKIAESLVYMRTLGTDVQVILDPSNEHGKGSEMDTLLNSNVEVYIDDKHAIAHNKVVISNRQKVLTGSFNFTNAAEKHNAENSLLLDCPGLAEVYITEFEVHKSHSRKISR